LFQFLDHLQPSCGKRIGLDNRTDLKPFIESVLESNNLTSRCHPGMLCLKKSQLHWVQRLMPIYMGPYTAEALASGNKILVKQPVPPNVMISRHHL
jgi:hypothetical protein